ncbi:uncharacterized protein OGAPODRAFT_88136 [Ogataea polymorpha]|uniref:uncharacterized protein n=1 Tax=Ogataea polymorpha TaxID=460523 RepID=UPI0007F33511|nr:uncharacterized protein OGAPODRAFT_88136 [Ogataea polymorpha]OBA15656.1 hypothetical protein OGAPODRAFT_88136 [Ogataea polymorpha]
MRYKPVEADEIEAQLKAHIGDVDSILQIGEDDCAVLMLKYEWNEQKLLEDFTTKEPGNLRRECGLATDTAVVSGLVETAGPEFMCAICCTEGPIETFGLSWCDHRYCVDCYVRYVRGSQTGLVKCPDTACHLYVRPGELAQLKRRNKVLLSRYWYAVVLQYTKKHARMFRNCPAVDCECFIEYRGFDSDVMSSVEEYVAHKYIPIVQCANGHRFCFACMSEDHAPATCAVVRKWIQTCEDETETSHWITANTKDCPKCSSPIEKNGGCNHMTCGECHYQFCWICLGDWSRHKNNFVCTSFDDEEAKKEREKQETSRVSLKKYLFYFDLFEIHRVSLKKDTEFLAKLEYKVQEIQQRAKVSWIEAHFYRESIDTLLRCRITLMWSYALMFYLESSKEKGMLEKTQSNLSNHVEALSKLFEITPTENVIKKKEMFLTKANALKTSHEKCIEIFMESLVLNRIKFVSDIE